MEERGGFQSSQFNPKDFEWGFVKGLKLNLECFDEEMEERSVANHGTKTHSTETEARSEFA